MEKSKILVIDDEMSIQKLIAVYLQMHGYQVIQANDGETGIKLLEENNFDLIICDINLPGLDGYGVYREFKSRNLDDIPFFFCSTLGKLPERLIGLQLGVDDYIVKPINPPELLLKVQLNISKARKLRTLKRLLQEKEEHGIMSGQLGEIDMPTMLQIVTFLPNQYVCIHLNSEQGNGKIYIEHGNLVHVELNNYTGKKAFFRLLMINEGAYQILKEEYHGQQSIVQNLNQSLFDNLTSLDEYRLALNNINLLDYYYCGITEENIADISAEYQDILTLFNQTEALASALNQSLRPDYEALQIISELIDKGVLILYQS